MRKDITSTLNTTLPVNLIGSSLSYRQLSARLNCDCKPFGVKVRVVRDRRLKFNKRQDFDVSGYFDTDRACMPISITVHLDPSREKVEFTPSFFSRFKFRFAQTLHHEMIHAEQWESRAHLLEKKIDIFPSTRLSKHRILMIDYLRDHHEIEAYAHDIAMEINTFYPKVNPATVIKRLERYRKVKTYSYFTAAFKNTEWQKVQKMLLRKIWKWVPTAPDFSPYLA